MHFNKFALLPFLCDLVLTFSITLIYRGLDFSIIVIKSNLTRISTFDFINVVNPLELTLSNVEDLTIEVLDKTHLYLIILIEIAITAMERRQFTFEFALMNSHYCNLISEFCSWRDENNLAKT